MEYKNINQVRKILSTEIIYNKLENIVSWGDIYTDEQYIQAGIIKEHRILQKDRYYHNGIKIKKNEANKIAYLYHYKNIML